MNPLDSLGLSVPIIQAPMAGTSTPDMTAAVSNAGALGSIAVGAVDATAARAMIDAVRARTDRPFNVNLFVHHPAQAQADVERRWIEALGPLFARYGAAPPPSLREIYRSFAADDAMLAMLADTRPAVISFHFGLPDAHRIATLKAAGCLLLATATSLAEALAARAAGIDAVVAQGFEAGGHRGMFDPQAPDACLGTIALTRLLVDRGGLPVIAAGGIMDGRGVRAALDLGAIAAQLGTAFIACPESSADAAHRAALFSSAAHHTIMTRAISGRPARCLPNRFTDWGATADAQSPDYPIAYDAGKALNQAAKAVGETGYGAQWAGQGAPLARSLPAADLIAALVEEMPG
ncbi:NAD(P)H-dependent flavin oxidoreductase [Sphingobium sp. CAP-1]|uniref:NAD(P)H-dependent flavin oxidoreductase n=1 Tax=Sphingobium sp. CAP-1 TaxID=2676077 RepID=UPI0012BB2022|nr:nitronate monooxygenase [Sphingobium sp. CAP-1]QGP78335.1 nitronate monooxygenase [Sphingobium sp. CAP-1]